MAYKITDKCISCGACAGQCPVGAIAEGDGKFEIDAIFCAGGKFGDSTGRTSECLDNTFRK